MLFVWILLIIASLIIIKYIYLIVKRALLISKIKKNADETIFFRNPFRSALIPDGKPDLQIRKGQNRFDIIIITIPFKRVRYHFEDNSRLELIIERNGVLVNSPRHVARATTLNYQFKIAKYRISFEKKEDVVQYVILNPAPKLITKVSGSILDYLYNGDNLFEEVKICGSKFFLEKVV